MLQSRLSLEVFLNEYFLSVLLAIVEGLTEFLPVSSTAHLRIAEALMKRPWRRLRALWATLPACRTSRTGRCTRSSFSWAQFWRCVFCSWGALSGSCGHFRAARTARRPGSRIPSALTLIAFAVTSVPSLLLHKWSEKHLGSIAVIAWAMLLGGIAMWVIDVWSDRQDATTRDVEEMGLGQAVWIGLCQTLSAIFPGTSRSMSTIAAGQVASLTRPAALEFSFCCRSTIDRGHGLGFCEGSGGAQGSGAGRDAAGMCDDFGALDCARDRTRGLVPVALGVVEWFLMWVRRMGLHCLQFTAYSGHGAADLWARFIGS